MRNKGFCDADRPHHIGVDHAYDLFIRETFERSRLTVTGIIENHIHSTHGQGFIYRAFDLLWVGYIKRQQYNA